MQFDLARAFYQIEVPVALRRFFSLPWWRSASSGSPPYAHFAAVESYADRWTHTLALCHTIVSWIARTAAPLSPSLEDNFLAPRLDSLVLSVYVDNFATTGTNAAHVREVGNAVLDGAHPLGLKTHELSLDSGNFELLGLSFSDTGLHGPKVRRQCTLAGAPRTAQDRPRFQS